MERRRSEEKGLTRRGTQTSSDSSNLEPEQLSLQPRDVSKSSRVGSRVGDHPAQDETRVLLGVVGSFDEETAGGEGEDCGEENEERETSQRTRSEARKERP